MAEGGYSFAQFGLMDEAQIVLKEDGTFEGSGPFNLSQLGSVPDCSVMLADFKLPTNITGKLLNDTHELQLNFEYGTGALSGSASCDAGTVTTKTVTMDASNAGIPTKATFPETGGTQQFVTENGAKPGNLTIIVEQQLTEIAR